MCLGQYDMDCRLLVLLEDAVPIAMLHVVDLRGWSVDGTGDARVAPGPSGVVLEVGSGFILIALEAGVEGPVRQVVGLVQDQGLYADSKAATPGVANVVLPDGNAVVAEAQILEALGHPTVGNHTLHSATAG